MSTRIQLTDHALERRYIGDALHARPSERAAHLAAAERVNAVDFGSALHGRIVGAMHELSRAQTEVSPLTVRQLLEQQGALTAIEALQNALDQYDPQLDSLAVMSARLVELARARRVREHHLRAAEAAERLDLEAAQEHARESLGENDHAHVELMSLHSSALVAVQSARKEQGAHKLRRIAFGYGVLDQALRGGLRPATMAIIGGRTGAGKSSLMLGSALQQASYGARVGIVSCEDAADIWGERALGHFVQEPMDRLLGAQLAMGGTDALGRALEHLKRVGVVLCYALNRPLADVLAAVRALIADGCEVIYVDYIQAVLLGRGDRKELVSEAAQRLKSECQLHGVPLVLGSQLSRADRRDRFAEPSENDLKETGDLENMTEVVVLLWKESDAETARALGKISKVKWSPYRPRFELQRDGVTGALLNLVPYDRSNGNGHSTPAGTTWT